MNNDWLLEEVDHLHANWGYLAEQLPRVLPGVRLPRQEATFLAWLDLSEVDRLRGADEIDMSESTFTIPREHDDDARMIFALAYLD